MSDTLSYHYQNSSAELAALETRKLALIALVKVSKTITRLLTSMEEVHRLSGKTFKLPPAMNKFYQCMYGKFKHDPTSIVESNLSEIENRIQLDMCSILRLTELNESDFMQYVEQSGDSTSGHKMRDIIQVFRRRAKTAISLRLILKERGISHAPLVLNVAESDLLATIKSLEKKEQRCVCHVKEDIEDFVKSIDVIFMDGHADQAVKEYLKEIRKGLIKNLEYLDAGKSIVGIPFSFEQVEVEKDEQQASAKSSIRDDLSIPLQEKPVKNIMTNQFSEMAKKAKTGFFANLWRWLNSPMHVSWAEKTKD